MNAPHAPSPAVADALLIAGRPYRSRLLVGTGKYRDFAETRAAVVASGAEIVTVAIRRTNIGQDPNAPSLLDALPPAEFTYLPNTAGCYTADDAVRTLRLARELLDGHTLVKLEVLGDPHTLFPNVRATLESRRDARAGRFPGARLHIRRPDHRARARGDRLRRDHAPGVADRIGDGHPQSVEPPAHHRGSQGAGAGRRGVGTASDAAIAMELGCAGVLMNTAIAAARDPVRMAGAMKLAVEAGREAFLAGRMPRKLYAASPSSPTGGLIG